MIYVITGCSDVIYLAFNGLALYKPPTMKIESPATITALHIQLIDNEKRYQLALRKGDQFSVLKGFSNIRKELKAKLESRLILTK